MEFIISLLVPIAITAISYMAFPLIMLAVNRGRFKKKRAKKIALWNSIVVGGIYCVLTIALVDDGTIWSATPAILYYWINRAILVDKSVEIENIEDDSKIDETDSSNSSTNHFCLSEADEPVQPRTRNDIYGSEFLVQSGLCCENKNQGIDVSKNNENLNKQESSHLKQRKSGKVVLVVVAGLIFLSLFAGIAWGVVSSRKVEWISEGDFFYYEEDDSFVLVFELANKNEKAISSDGCVEITIVNDDGVVVYDSLHSFVKDDFEEWLYNDVEGKFLASIYINPRYMILGTSSSGWVYFTVYGDDYYFEEFSLRASDLPLLPVNINTPKLPLNVHYYGYKGDVYTTTRIDSVTYEILHGDDLYIYFSGKKTYDCDGNDAENSCYFDWKLYDTQGYLIDRGTVSVLGLVVGDKFKEETGYAFDCIEPGKSYEIVITEKR